jgi:enterochelin esterase-like enzyme
MAPFSFPKPHRVGCIGLPLALLLGACAPAATAFPAAAPATTASPDSAQVTAAAPTAMLAPTPAAAPIALDTQQELLDAMAAIIAAPPAEAQARADALWQALVSSRREPLIFDTEAYFFYKGQAESVDWRGGFNQWAVPGLVGIRVGATDLWMAQFPMPAASRAEYAIAVDDQALRGDAANPLTQPTGLTTTNSLLVMPGFTVSDEGQRRAGVSPGSVGASLSLTSQYLGYVVDYWVYTPAGYDHLAGLPALYLLDGETFLREWRGALPIVLDNLIAAGRIPPVLAVFVDEREPGNPQHNRREAEFIGHPVEHARFLAEELVPAIDRAYRTDPRAAARVIAGVSYGGLSATFIGLTQSDTFQNLAAFSPSLWTLNYPESQPNAQQATGMRLMQPPIWSVTRCSTDCPRLPLRIFMTSGIPNWDVGDLSPVVDSLRRQGYPVSFQQAREAHTWSQWRGLSDEMLTFFFGAN